MSNGTTGQQSAKASVRIYVGCTVEDLAELQRTGELALEQLPCHGLTGAMREWYTSDDAEELEFAALCEAAASSLARLQGLTSEYHRRVVLAVDVSAAQVSPISGTGRARSAVQGGGMLKLKHVASIHVDEPESRPTITAAVDCLAAAAAGDEDAQFAQDEADACDLLWFDSSELGELVSELQAT